ncbi:transposase [Nonomuraea zeae]|uniref:transposase n=1 Tax=Nonomuraea zeae TaxID=1642303 RepID=UPI001F0E7C39|nr:transposase [Nonomuraea zeae]
MLYPAAKADPGRRFHALYDKVCRREVLQRGWVAVRANNGAPGIDTTTLAQVEEYGVARLLDELADELREGRYRPLPARRVLIPKPGTAEQRPLSIPAVRDRIVQAALKIVFEPVFEADMLGCSFGFRPKRSAHDALQVLIEERVCDQSVLKLLRVILRAGVMAEGQMLGARGLLPGEHYLDSGYPSAELLVGARERFGIALITPVLLDQSSQARAAAGYDRAAFTIDGDAEQARCPQGQASSSWSRCTQRGTEAIVVKFRGEVCRPCPVRSLCTSATRGGRQLTIRARPLQEALDQARADQISNDWQDKYKLRAGVEGTVRQAVAVAGVRRARYRGLAKVHLEHVFSAVALNLIRLDAWWNGHPLDRTRTGHLARLQLAELSLTA